MDRDRKKQLRQEVRRQQRAAARAALPLDPDELREMFDMLDRELPRQGCDHTRRLTKSWLESRRHNIARVFAWLDDNGGFCDCEILANSEQAFDEAMKDA